MTTPLDPLDPETHDQSLDARVRPSDEAILHRALVFAHEALKAADVQLQRARIEDPDLGGMAQWWIDLQFFIIALRRLRRAGELAAAVQNRGTIEDAIRDFDNALPKLGLLRNVGEHIDAYSREAGRDRSVRWRQIQVGGWDKTTFEWLGVKINADVAMAACRRLVGWIEIVRAEEMGATEEQLREGRTLLESKA